MKQFRENYPRTAEEVMALPELPLEVMPENFLLRSTADDACWLARYGNEAWAPCFTKEQWWRMEVTL